MLLQSEDQDLGLSVGHLVEVGGLGVSGKKKTGRRSHGVWPVQPSHSLYLEHMEDEGAAVAQVVDHLEVIDVAVH